jgi:hypothetical protein
VNRWLGYINGELDSGRNTPTSAASRLPMRLSKGTGEAPRRRNRKIDGFTPDQRFFGLGANLALESARRRNQAAD